MEKNLLTQLELQEYERVILNNYKELKQTKELKKALLQKMFV